MADPTVVGSTPGPVLVAAAHGSTQPAAVAEVHALVELAAALRPGLVVRTGFLSDTSPSLAQVLVELGPTPAVVLPLLLVAAAHSKGDVPASVALARAGGAVLRYGRPLGPHPLLLAAAAGRLAEAGVDQHAPVVLVAAGSADPAANAELVATGRLLAESRGLAPVEVAFASATAPSLAEALHRLDRLGHDPAGVAVLPYLLGPGRFAAAIAASAAELGATCAGPLGAHPALARLLLERYDEARLGDLRMNCDVCLYRVPVAGRAGQVGAPQRPHPHPDDPS